MFFINKKQVPADRWKDVTYGRIVCDFRPNKSEPNRTRLMVGGDRINYPEDCGTPTADLTLVKLIMNSVISTEGARFMTGDIKNFYLNTPLKRYEYLRLRLSDLPDEIIEEYKLNEKATPDGMVFLEVRKGMYGLPQAGLLAQELLAERLAKKGYHQSKTTPGLWKHKWRPVQFTLVVDDFGVKYVGKEHAEHLMEALKEHYEVSEDWTGSKYCGLTLKWDHKRRKVHLSMPGYIKRALKRFHHKSPARPQNSPYPHIPPKYGQRQQYVEETRESPPVSKADKIFIMQVTGTFLYYARALDSTMLPALSAIASQQADPTEETMSRTLQFLDYVASQEEAIITFRASDMVLTVHSDAGYLNEPGARSRVGGHFFMSNNDLVPENNG